MHGGRGGKGEGGRVGGQRGRVGGWEGSGRDTYTCTALMRPNQAEPVLFAVEAGPRLIMRIRKLREQRFSSIDYVCSCILNGMYHMISIM